MATLVTGRMVEDQSITLNDLTQSSGALMFRNKIINGDMRIDQRNAGTSKSISVNTVTYSVDRWYGYSLGSGITQQRVTSTVPGLSYALRTTGAASNTQAEATQRIESDTAASMAGQKVTISFYASSSVTKNYTLFVARPTTTTDDYTSSTIIDTYNFTATTALTRYTYTLTLPAQANLGLAVGIVTATGSGGLGVGQYFDLTGVQIEIGEVATPFEWKPIGMELALCQRYFETNYLPNQVVGTNINASRAGTWAGYPNGTGVNAFFFYHPTVKFAVKKRAIPNVNFYNPIDPQNNINAFISESVLDGQAEGFNIGTDNFLIKASTGMYQPTYHYIRWAASAEL